MPERDPPPVLYSIIAKPATKCQHVLSFNFALMNCLSANRRGPCGPIGAVSIIPDEHEKVDWSLANALMTSRDAVAIDTVESTLGGYHYESIRLPKNAAANGVGAQDLAAKEAACRPGSFFIP